MVCCSKFTRVMADSNFSRYTPFLRSISTISDDSSLVMQKEYLSLDELDNCSGDERPSAFYLRRKRLSSRPEVFDFLMWPGRQLQQKRDVWDEFLSTNGDKIQLFFLALAYVLYHVYLGFAINYDWSRSSSWCDGCRLLIVLTCLAYCGVLYYKVVKPYYSDWIVDRLYRPVEELGEKVYSQRGAKWVFGILLVAALVTFYVLDTANNRRRLVSLSGILCIVLIGFMCSKHPTQILWRHVAWGLGIQFMMGLLILRWDFGRDFFRCISDKVVKFLSFADAGTGFVFDFLATGNISSITLPNSINGSTNSSSQVLHNIIVESIFAFKVLPVIMFFSFFISILFYYGIMQRVVIALGWILQISIGTTAAESMNAAASVFVGMTEAPLMIKPYISLMTKSELHAVMAGGFATIAGTVFAAYISFGIDGSYLLSGAMMSAPAALALSKLVYPETEESLTTFKDIKIEKGEEKNVIEAAANGATSAVSLVAGIVAGLITFIAFVQFLNALVSWAGSLIGWDFLSLEWLLGHAFIPLAYMMGVEWEDCESVGTLIGLKSIVNEFVAYQRLQTMKHLSKRSVAIATYALCSFANISSLGTQVAILGTMVPDRKSDFTDVGLRALCTGASATFLTACMAGSLLEL